MKCLDCKASQALGMFIPGIHLAHLAIIVWLTRSQFQEDTWEGLVGTNVLRSSNLYVEEIRHDHKESPEAP